MKRKLYEHIASMIDAAQRCERTGNTEWYDRHTNRIEYLCKNHMPSGCGVDSGTSFDFNVSNSDKLVFKTSYHHMNEHGYYDGWTDHTVVVRPSLIHGITLHITGRNRNDIKDYLHDLFSNMLCADIDDNVLLKADGLTQENENAPTGT